MFDPNPPDIGRLIDEALPMDPDLNPRDHIYPWITALSMEAMLHDRATVEGLTSGLRSRRLGVTRVA